MCSPTVSDALRSLTNTYRGQGRLADAAELERLSKEKNLDRAQISKFIADISIPEKKPMKANVSSKPPPPAQV